LSLPPHSSASRFAIGGTQTFESLAHGRNNNFNLTRMLAASAVIVSHSFALPIGSWHEPFIEYEFTLGGLAVSVFFALSGFLISASFERRPSLMAFGLARALRILPALAVVTTLTALVLGPLVTSLSLASYFGDRHVWSYAPKALSLWWMVFNLPGVFETLRYKVVNGPLWTLYYEVTCYIGLALVMRAEMKAKGIPPWLIFALYALLYLALVNIGGSHHTQMLTYAQLSLPFVLGMIAYRFRKHIPANGLIAAGLALLAVICLNFGVLAFEIRMLAVSYAALCLAQINSRRLHRYNMLGDYSYGVYIYGWPIQQLFLLYDPTIHPIALITVTLPAAILCGILSWYLVERPALARKQSLSLIGARFAAQFDRSAAHR
jgi:peptidoglycan/LPS O-acetylase OafA/YrhL